jgi:hypothetical protein
MGRDPSRGPLQTHRPARLLIVMAPMGPQAEYVPTVRYTTNVGFAFAWESTISSTSYQGFSVSSSTLIARCAAEVNRFAVQYVSLL